MSHELRVLGMNDDLWERFHGFHGFHGLGSETWTGCECFELLLFAKIAKIAPHDYIWCNDKGSNGN